MYFYHTAFKAAFGWPFFIVKYPKTGSRYYVREWVSLHGNPLAVKIKSTLFLFLALSPAAAFAQSVTASAGGSATLANTIADWTIGEPLTVSFSTGTTTVTQGFQQPADITSRIIGGDLALAGLSVYPNPATDVLNIAFAQQQGAVRFSITDASGRTFQPAFLSPLAPQASAAQLSLSGLAAGPYVLRIESGARVATFLIIKNK